MAANMANQQQAKESVKMANGNEETIMKAKIA